MSAPVSLPLPTRFVGLDVHQQSIMATAVDAHQQTVLRPQRLALAEFAIWAQTHLASTAAVVLEATTNAWPLYDLLQPLVASVTVVHSKVVQLITTARVKTDARDALHLARRLRTGLLTSIWVPPKEVRELRTLVAHRRRLIQQRTQIRNHLQSILHASNLASPAGEPFAQRQRGWWLALEVSAADRLRIRQGWAELGSVGPAPPRGRNRADPVFDPGAVGGPGSLSGPSTWHRRVERDGGACCHRRHCALPNGQASGGLQWVSCQYPCVRPNSADWAHHQRRPQRSPHDAGRSGLGRGGASSALESCLPAPGCPHRQAQGDCSRWPGNS